MDNPDKRIIWSPEAERDLLEIWDYQANAYSPTIADDHLLDIERVLHRLVHLPHFGKSREDLYPDLRAQLVYPHIICYRPLHAMIQVVRVLHQRRDIDSAIDQ